MTGRILASSVLMIASVALVLGAQDRPIHSGYALKQPELVMDRRRANQKKGKNRREW